jgi:thioredoxin-related protein
MRLLLLPLLLLGNILHAVTPLDSIQNVSQQNGKNIAVYFSGSDWCINCHQFKKSILDNAAVMSLLDSTYIYYVADFPQRTKLDQELVKLNEALAAKLNPDGIFPVLIIADNKWNILTRIYKGNAVTAVEEKLKRHRAPSQ